ncbi:MAG: flavodoxin [Pseudorhodobacter sp.]|nr:MAG: flavodoxin [Pseudorhodobacter sp.]
MTRRFLFLTTSPRATSNSSRLAAEAAKGLPPGTEARWLDLNAPALPAFRDLRPGHAGVPMGRLGDIFGQIMLASDIVIAAPIYWYAFPAPLHLMLSHLSGWLDVPELRMMDSLKAKRMWLVTSRADPDPAVPEQAEAMLRRTALWLGMAWGGALHGVADAPGQIEGSDAMARAVGFLA